MKFPTPPSQDKLSSRQNDLVVPFSHEVRADYEQRAQLWSAGIATVCLAMCGPSTLRASVT